VKQTFFVLTILFLIAGGPQFLNAVENEHPATAQEMSHEKEHYEKNMEERLSKLGKKLDEIKAKAAAMTEQARKEMSQYVADAEKKQKAASQKLSEIRKESGKKWKKFTSEMDAAADDFAKAYERAKSHFKD
jgi:ribosome recycling factor